MISLVSGRKSQMQDELSPSTSMIPSEGSSKSDFDKGDGIPRHSIPMITAEISRQKKILDEPRSPIPTMLSIAIPEKISYVVATYHDRLLRHSRMMGSVGLPVQLHKKDGTLHSLMTLSIISQRTLSGLSPSHRISSMIYSEGSLVCPILRP